MLRTSIKQIHKREKKQSNPLGVAEDDHQIESAGPVAKDTGLAALDTMRKYRRHPKPDEHAPERPPSAYVIFSNQIREEVKGQDLSFTQIAKLVGDRWQKLNSQGREPYEEQAKTAEEHYNIQLSAYRQTDAFKNYSQYLTDFKAKHRGVGEVKSISGTSAIRYQPKEADLAIGNQPKISDLEVKLHRLGLEQYVDVFIGQGFGTWDMLLDIQETDFEALGVKLSHRRVRLPFLALLVLLMSFRNFNEP
jgi:hypothetical protein